MDQESANYVKENVSQEKWEEIINHIPRMPSGLNEENLEYLNDILKVDEENPEFDVGALLVKLYEDHLHLRKSDLGNSEKGLMIQILVYVIESFEFWSKVNDPAETTYTRKFADLSEILYRGTNITADDGGHVCAETTSQRNMNEMKYASSSSASATSTTSTSSVTTTTTTGNHSGLKIDLIVKGNITKTDYSCNEWKSKDSGDQTNLQQQAKNLKANICLLNKLHAVTSNEGSMPVFCMDWIGAFGYLYSLTRFENVVVAKHYSDLMIPLQKEVLNIFADTVKVLFCWKNHNTSVDRDVARGRTVNRRADVLGAMRSTLTSTIVSSSHIDVMPSPKLQPSRSNSRKRSHDSEE